ncbi:hypothetical protein ACVW0Y_004408 [Pseudomonas sp. TE3786]
MFGDDGSKANIGRLGLGMGLSCCLVAQGWAAPPPPGELIPEIQHEFARLYDLSDSALELQVEPTLEVFPEYRADLLKYLGTGASPERRKLLEKVSKASKEELAAWFETDAGKVGISAAVAVGAVAAIAATNKGGSGHHPPANPAPPADDPTPVVPAPPPVVPPVAPVVPPVAPVVPPAGPVVPPVAPPVVTPEPKPDPGLDPSARATYRTTEFKTTQTLNAIHADYAYARGGTGEGVVISVQDVDQINTLHPELVNQMAVGSVLGGEPDYAAGETDGHGTAVARTALGEKNGVNYHGVAYDAKLLTHWGQGDSQVVDREIQYGARISNHSYVVGGTNQQIADTWGAMYQRGVDAGIIYVWAAGNDKTQPEPSSFASMPLLVPGLKGNWLAVIAVDLNYDWANEGNATASSLQGNPCGAAKAWCIAAPGFGFQVPTPGGISFTTGSSLAAPTVSGALAVLMDVFPTLTSEQIVNRVLVSANKTGIYADQNVYGQGLLDLDTATRPIGALMINTQSGMAIPISRAAMAESSPLGNAVRSALSTVNLVLKDSLDAPFLVKGDALGNGQVAERSRIDTVAYLQRQNLENTQQQLHTAGGLRMTYSEGGEGSGLAGLGQVQAWQPLGNNLALSASVNTDPSWSQGLLDAQPALRNTSVTEAFSNPYLSLQEQASGAGLRWNMGQNWHSAVQVQTAKAAERFSDRPSHEQQHSVQSEWGYTSAAGLSASVQLGALQEQQRLLGAESDSWLGNGQSRTVFSGLNVNVPVGQQWNLYGRYNTGRTTLQGNGWAQAAALRSDSFTLGVLGQPDPQLQVGALVYQPLRVKSGNLKTELPTGLNADNSVAMNRVNLNLSAEARHMEYELFMRYELPAWAINFKGSLLRVEDYNNQAGNNDSMVMFNAGMQY